MAPRRAPESPFVGPRNGISQRFPISGLCRGSGFARLSRFGEGIHQSRVWTTIAAHRSSKNGSVVGTRIALTSGGPNKSGVALVNQTKERAKNEKFINFAHFCEFWCFSFGKQARFTLNFCSGMPPRKVHKLTFLWLGLPGPLLDKGGHLKTGTSERGTSEYGKGISGGSLKIIIKNFSSEGFTGGLDRWWCRVWGALILAKALESTAFLHRECKFRRP